LIVDTCKLLMVDLGQVIKYQYRKGKDEMELWTGDRIVYFFIGTEVTGKRFYEAEILEIPEDDVIRIIITACKRHPERVGQMRKVNMSEITICAINGKEVEKEYVPETSNSKDVTDLMRLAFDLVDGQWFKELADYKNTLVGGKNAKA
jgi:hypothetical protein